MKHSHLCVEKMEPQIGNTIDSNGAVGIEQHSHPHRYEELNAR